MAQALGIDIGGTGIKGAVVDLTTGELVTERHRVPTPDPSTPHNVADVIVEITKVHGWNGSIGATFPAVVKNGVAYSAANVDKSWIGTDVDSLFTKATNCSVTVMNDADAAGVAEVRFGAAKDVSGVVLMLTLGTGIGSALFLDGLDAETQAAASARDRSDLSWHQWSKRLQHYLEFVERLFTPDLFVLGGGVSKKPDKWLPLLKVQTPIKVAQLANNAGIVGAAIVAHESDAALPPAGGRAADA